MSLVKQLIDLETLDGKLEHLKVKRRAAYNVLRHTRNSWDSQLMYWNFKNPTVIGIYRDIKFIDGKIDIINHKIDTLLNLVKTSYQHEPSPDPAE